MKSFLKWFQSIGMTPRDPDAVGCGDKACQADPRHLVTTSEAHPGFVATVSGRLFDVLHPDPAEIEIDEIAHALSLINRFAGHTKYPYSVGQHSILCADECASRYLGRFDLALACLLHDAAEAYCCDVIRPIKRIIAKVYRPLEDAVQSAVWQRFNVQMTPEVDAVIHEIDNAVVYAESRELMKGSESWNWSGVEPASVRILPCKWKIVRDEFTRRFHQLKYSRRPWPQAVDRQ